MKFKTRVLNTFTHIQEQFRNKTFTLIIVNSAIILIDFLYIFMRRKYISSDVIPFWYTKMWGTEQLAPATSINIIPMISFFVLAMGATILAFNKYYIQYLNSVIWVAVTGCNLLLAFSIFRIINISAVPFEPFINPVYLSLFPPFVLSFFAVYLLTPYYIDYAHSKKIVTNPKIHQHPGMVLQNPSARGAGFLYGLVFFILGILYVGINKQMSGLYFSVLMISVLGYIDDYQNTHPGSGMEIFEKPGVRLLLLFLSITPIILSGLVIDFVSNPLGGVLNLNSLSINLGGTVIPVVASLFTCIWIVWVLNVLSWSNGIDGQYSGIVGIASVLIAVLALRFDSLVDYHYKIAILSAISAGISFGFTKYTWFPSKIMWGFGAMSAGLVLSVLAITAQSKIAFSILVILVPFMDAVVTFIRRIIQGKSPLSGDKGHLHHLLLEAGWSPSKIALFYWFCTAFFGLIGLLTPDRYVFQATLVVIGIVAFVIIIMNFKNYKKKPAQETSIL